MYSIIKDYIKGYLGLPVVCLIVCLVPVVFLSTISVSMAIVLYFVLPIAFLFLGITYYFFKDKLQASGKPQNNVDEQIQRQYLDSSGRRNNKFVLYLLIVTVSFVVNFVGFMAFEKGIFFLGFGIGKDKIEFNAHRIYGKIRLPLVTINFKLMDIIGKFNWEKANWKIQPILVLKNILKQG